MKLCLVGRGKSSFSQSRLSDDAVQVFGEAMARAGLSSMDEGPCERGAVLKSSAASLKLLPNMKGRNEAKYWLLSRGRCGSAFVSRPQSCFCGEVTFEFFKRFAPCLFKIMQAASF